jgi:protease-4
MWHAVRRVAKRKPVIVSIGDMAASGGYYVACAGTEIFAEDESLVGSIGVVGGKIVAEKLAERMGVHAVTLARGQNADWGSPFKPFSDTERAAVLRAMHDTYDTFLSRIREGRKIDASRLAAVAEGRIMTGQRARAGGLVDSVGGLPQALARARTKAGLPDDAPLEVWHKEHSLLGLVSQLASGVDSRVSALPAGLLALPDFMRAPLLLALLQRERGPLTALPYALELN